MDWARKVAGYADSNHAFGHHGSDSEEFQRQEIGGRHTKHASYRPGVNNTRGFGRVRGTFYHHQVGHQDLHIKLQNSANQDERDKTPLQMLLNGTLSPPPSSEAPIHNLPNHIALLISEEASLGYRTVYRGTVNSTGHDVHVLEEAMPVWLIEYLLTNKIPILPPLVKIGFILLPYPNKDPSGEQLPELLNTLVSNFYPQSHLLNPNLNRTQSKLTASRWLRVRKLVNHVNRFFWGLELCN